MASVDQSAMIAFVERLQRRSSLSDDESNALLAMRGRTTIARANVDIVSPDQHANHVSLIIDGLVGRFGQVIDGRRQITALHIAGDMCDLHSLVAPATEWPLQALTPTAIMQVSHAQLLAVARTYPNIAEAFWRDCSVDAAILSQWVVNVGRRDARSRMAHLFCEMAVRFEDAGDGCRTHFTLPMSQTQLGDALGMTSVHVNRTLKALREGGLVMMSHHEVRVPCWRALANVADFDPHYLQICLSRAAAAAMRPTQASV